MCMPYVYALYTGDASRMVQVLLAQCRVSTHVFWADQRGVLGLLWRQLLCPEHACKHAALMALHAFFLVGLTCMPCMSALYVCLICMPYMYDALYACLELVSSKWRTTLLAFCLP